MKEKILETWVDMGFKLEEVGDLGYSFKYEGAKFLYLTDADEDFLSISIPGFYELEDGDVAKFCCLSEKINSTLKYVKAYSMADNMWLMYERELIGDEDLEKIILRMIIHLSRGLDFARKTIAEIETLQSDSSDNDNTESNEDSDE